MKKNIPYSRVCPVAKQQGINRTGHSVPYPNQVGIGQTLTRCADSFGIGTIGQTLIKIPLISLILLANLFANDINSPNNIGISKSLTVYNSGIGYIKENRAFEIINGSIVYENVSQNIITDSVNVQFDKDIQLLTQKYIYDTVNISNILKYYIDKEIEIYNKKTKDNTYIESGILLGTYSNNILFQQKTGKIISVPLEDVVIPNLPPKMQTKPSLIWKVIPNNNINGNVNISYLTNGIKWKSDYTANIQSPFMGENKKMLLSGWITIDNSSGIAYDNVDLSVVAGDVNRIQNRPIQYKTMRAEANFAAMDKIEPETITAGYKLYKIPFKTNINNNEKTSINFINEEVEYDKVIKYNSNLYSEEEKQQGRQTIKFKTKIPMPTGVFRVYGNNVFLGENNLPNTPEKDIVEIEIGNNFDNYLKSKIYNKEDKNVIINGKTYKYHYKTEKEFTFVNRGKEIEQIELKIDGISNDMGENKGFVDFKIKDVEKDNIINVSDNINISDNIKISGNQTKTITFKLKKQSEKKFKIQYNVYQN